MIVDTSALIAATTLTETLIVLPARHGTVARTVFDRLRTEIRLELVNFTADHAYAANAPMPASAAAATPPASTSATA